MGKWETIRDDDIQSIEFNESNSFVLVEKNDNGVNKVNYGSFEIIDKTHIDLIGYGSLSNFSSASNDLDFTLQKLTGEILEFASERVLENISQTSTSETLCQTWKILTVEGIDLEDANIISHVVFSQAGTYVVANISDEDYLMHSWKWKNDSEEYLCYSPLNLPLCDGPENEIKILELSEDSLAFSHMEKVFGMVPIVE